MARKPRRQISTESDDQIKLVAWLRGKGIRVVASANGGKRHLLEAIKLKRMGVSAGFPDLEIPLPKGVYHGLYIEMKREEGGVVSDAQQDWLTYLNSVGYCACVCTGFNHAKEVVLAYLALPT